MDAVKNINQGGRMKNKNKNKEKPKKDISKSILGCAAYILGLAIMDKDGSHSSKIKAKSRAMWSRSSTFQAIMFLCNANIIEAETRMDGCCMWKKSKTYIKLINYARNMPMPVFIENISDAKKNSRV